MELVYDVLYLRAYIFHTFPSAPYVHVLFPITHLLLTSSSLPRDDDMLQESGIYTGQVMILEVKKDDGTWPRETYVSQSSMVSCVFSVYASLNSSTEHCCMVNIALLCNVCFSCCFLLASQNPTRSNDTSLSSSYSSPYNTRSGGVCLCACVCVIHTYIRTVDTYIYVRMYVRMCVQLCVRQMYLSVLFVMQQDLASVNQFHLIFIIAYQ